MNKFDFFCENSKREKLVRFTERANFSLIRLSHCLAQSSHEMIFSIESALQNVSYSRSYAFSSGNNRLMKQVQCYRSTNGVRFVRQSRRVSRVLLEYPFETYASRRRLRIRLIKFVRTQCMFN